MLPYLIGALLIILLSILQTNLLSLIAIAGVRPDLVLIFTVYLANRNGGMVGQGAGFIGGLTHDIFSIAPLGFYTLTKTVVGLIYGFTRDNVYLDAFLAPFLLVLTATVLKGVMFLLIGALFGVSDPSGPVLSTRFLIEIGYNSLLGPVVFGILGRFRGLELDWRAQSF